MNHEPDAVRDRNEGQSGSNRNRASTTESMGSFNGLLGGENAYNFAKTSESIQWRSLFAFTTKQHVFVLTLAVLAGIASGVIDPITTIFIGKIFQAFTDFGGKAIESTDLKSQVTINSLILAGLGTADWIFNAIFLFLWVVFGELQARTVRTRLFDGLLGKSTGFYDTLPSGVEALTPRLQTHIRELQLATSQPLGYILSATTAAIASLVIALKFEWSLTLILLSTMPINALVVGFMSTRMVRNTQKQVNQLVLAVKNAANSFAAIETVKTFNGQSSDFNKFASSIKKAAGYYIRQVQGNALEIGYMKCMTLLTFMIGFWYGSHLVISGQRTTGDIITTFYSCMELTASIQSILPQMIILEKGRVSGAVLKGFADPIIPDSNLGYGTRPRKCEGGIAVQNVSFAYPCRPRHQVLKNVNCSFAAGKTAFLVGRSGSGKSSLAQLLLRLYQPDSGQIFLDGYSLDDVDLLWLRKNITIVEQQSVLFDATIFENIAAGSHNVDKVSIGDVKAAAEFALLLNTVQELPDGFETRIGLKGHSLSGGQRQRLTIARARIRNTPILILDESTSALDSTSKRMVVSAIRKWRRNKTTIFVTHDMSLIHSNDFVYIFEDGSIVEADYRWAFAAKTSSKFAFLFNQKSDGVTTANAIFNQENDEVQGFLNLSPQTGNETFYASATEDKLPKRRNRRSIIDIIPGICRNANVFDAGLISPPGISDPTQSFLRSRSNPVEFSPISRTSLSVRQGFSLEADSCSSHDSEGNALTRNDIDSTEIELGPIRGTQESAIRRRSSVINLQQPKARASVEKCSPKSPNPSSQSVGTKRELRKPHNPGNKPGLLEILRTVWPNLDKRTRRILLGAFFSTLVHAISIPLFSWIFSKLLSTFYVDQGAAQAAMKWSLSVLVLSLVDGTACYGMHIQFEYSAQVWVDSVRLEAMRRILDQPREFFADERNSSSQLAYSLDRNAEEMRNILARFIPFVAVAIVMMGVAISWCLTVCWKLTLVGVTLTPLSWGTTRLYQVITERLESQTNDAGESAAAVLNEAFTNIKTVRALTLESTFRQQHEEACKTAFKIGVKRAFYCGTFYGISQAIMVFNNSVIYFYGAILASSYAYSVQDMLLVFSQLLFALGNVTTIISIIPQVSSSKDTARRIMNLANLPQDSHENSGRIKPLEIWDITLADLSFSYSNRPSEVVLRNVNVKFPRGFTTALVGASGSGKSTIASLLLKLYPLARREEGKTPMLSINGRDIRTIYTPALRNLITVVAQIPVLLPCSVAENIAYGLGADSRVNKTEAIRTAAAAAGIDDFLLSLPNGYDTLIGDGGIGLSGGQAQRVAIARALIRKPSVLILDEATSALDGESAKMIHETVRRLVSENSSMTIIIITHSRDMMLLADRIVVLDRGQVVDEGSYDELANRPGKFSGLLDL